MGGLCPSYGATKGGILTMTIVCAKELGKLVMLKYFSALPFLIPHLDPVVKPCSGPKHVQALQIQEVHPRPRTFQCIQLSIISYLSYPHIHCDTIHVLHLRVYIPHPPPPPLT